MISMTPKEKALKLCQQFGLLTFATKHNDGYTFPLEIAKQCALIAVDEILKEVPTEILDTYKQQVNFINNDRYYYWEEVKSEIEKL